MRDNRKPTHENTPGSTIAPLDRLIPSPATDCAQNARIPFWIVDGDDEPELRQEQVPNLAPHPFHLLAAGRYVSRRERAAVLHLRMQEFSEIYHAAWHVRATQFGSGELHQEKIGAFIGVLKQELTNCQDPEALIFAVAEALTAFPYNLPWEG